MDKSTAISINFYNFLHLHKDGKKMSKNVHHAHLVRIKTHIRRNATTEECQRMLKLKP